MISQKTLYEIDELSTLYELRWGKKLDDSIIPRGMDQEQYVRVLKRIVDTGESILVGWNKLFLHK